jgi:hypothetical protein
VLAAQGLALLQPAFREALARYLELHAHALSPEVLASVGHSSMGPKYLVAMLDSQAGLCNRMEHVASALVLGPLLGMLTDRAVLFDWRSQGAVGYHEGVESISQADLAELFMPVAGFEPSLDAAAARAGIPAQQVLGAADPPLISYWGDFLEALRCHRPERAYSARVLHISRFEWWAAAALANPHHAALVGAWFPGGADGARVFQHVAAVLFAPSRAVAQLVDSIKAREAAAGQPQQAQAPSSPPFSCCPLRQPPQSQHPLQ